MFDTMQAKLQAALSALAQVDPSAYEPEELRRGLVELRRDLDDLQAEFIRFLARGSADTN